MRAGEMDHCGKAGIGLFVARGDPPKRLELAEEIFHQVSPTIHREVARYAACPIGFGWDDGESPSLVQIGAKPIIVEGFVGDQRREVDVCEQRFDTDAVVALARQKDEARQIAEGVDQRDDLGRQAAARAADRLILSPPLAPVPCWWTRTMVPSMIAYSKSGSPDKCRKTVSKTPLSAQRRKRRKTEFQFPKFSWRSRQGEPVRAIHRTASRNSRLSAPLRPGSPGLPGSSGSIRTHCSSLNALRSMAGLRFPALNQNSLAAGIPRDQRNVHRP